MKIGGIIAVALLLWAASAGAQWFNPIVSRPYESVFDNSGNPLAFFSQNPAVNYDNGGQGIAYNVPVPGCTGSGCGGPAAAYRPDDVNFKTSTFGTGFPFQLTNCDCPNSFNYTMSISSPGPYTITIWAGSPSAGGSWNVFIDNVLMVNVPTQNTGSYATLAASTSAPFNATLGTHILQLAWGTGDAAGSAGDLVAWRGQVSPPQSPLLPPDRDASPNWKMAGLQSVGGIPNRTTQCGATVSPIGGGSNDATNIQNAINACSAGQFVNLASGTFTVSEGSYLLLNKGITVRGAGAGNTIITRPAGPGSWSNQGACSTGGAWGATLGCSNPGNNPTPMFIVSPLARFNPNNVTGTTLTSDGAQGASSIQVSSTAGLTVGQIVLLDELSGASFVPDIEGRATSIFASPDYRVTYHIHSPACCNDDGTNVEDDYTVNHDRMTNEIKQISAINGNTVTFDSPLTISYRTSHTAELWQWATPFLQSAGIENMTLQHADDAQVEFDWCAYCWAQNVEQTLWLNEAFAINESFRTQLERDYIHDGAWCVPGGGGYNISMRYDSSEILIENSISIRCNKVMVSRASGAGSVVGYNYMDMGYIAGSCCWQEMGLNSSHLVGPHHTLFEGNWGFNGDGDATHGNSTNMTFFRNWLTGLRSTFVGEDGVTWNDSATHCTGGAPMRAVGPEAYHWWYSYIGNVLGSPCSTVGNGWNLSGNNQTNPAILLLGWDDQTSGFNDPNVRTIYPAVGPNCSPSSPNCSTVMDGNYDYFRSQVTWASNDANHTLPNSLYLSGAPAFFGPGASCTYAWPWITPTGASQVLTNSCGNSGLPAKARFDAGTPFVQP